MTTLWIALLALPATAQVRLGEKCEVHFAGREEGIKAIIHRDAFTENLSRFDLQSRLGTDKDVTLADWDKFIAAEVLDWSEEDIQRISGILDSIRDRLAKIKVPLPEKIYLIETTGKEESNAAYTRGLYIVLPRDVVARPREALESLLIHELFHVISYANPELRVDLYKILGFRYETAIEVHKSFANRRITNPDAPVVNCVMTIRDAEQSYVVTPLLYARSDFDPKKEKSLFGYMEFRLMVVLPFGKGYVAADKDGRPVVIDPKKSSDFHKQIGENTKYIIHPEEILADNFVHLVLGRENVPTPKILAELKKVLAR